MPARLPASSRAARDQLTTSSGIWISDALLSTTYNRFTRSHRLCSSSRRHGSHVPGPLEFRRRLAKRRMTGLTERGNLPPPPADYSVFNILFGGAKKAQQPMIWQAPRATRTLEPRCPDGNHLPLFTDPNPPPQTLPSFINDLPSTPPLTNVPLATSDQPHEAQSLSAEQPLSAATYRRQCLEDFKSQLRSHKLYRTVDFARVATYCEALRLDRSDPKLRDTKAHLIAKENAQLRLDALAAVIDLLRQRVHVRRSPRSCNFDSFLTWVWKHCSGIAAEDVSFLVNHALQEVERRQSSESRNRKIAAMIRIEEMPFECLDMLGVEMLCRLAKASESSLESRPHIVGFLESEAQRSLTVRGTHVRKMADFCKQKAVRARDTIDITSLVSIFDLGRSSLFLEQVTREMLLAYKANHTYFRPNNLDPNRLLNFWLECMRSGLARSGDPVPRVWSDTMLWRGVFDSIAQRVEPCAISQHLAGIKSAEIGHIVLRHWVPLYEQVPRELLEDMLTTYDEKLKNQAPRALGHYETSFYALIETLNENKVDKQQTLIQIFRLLENLRPDCEGRGKMATFIHDMIELDPQKNSQGLNATSQRAIAEGIHIISKTFPRRALTLARKYKEAPLSLFPSIAVTLAGLGRNNVKGVVEMLIERPDHVVGREADLPMPEVLQADDGSRNPRCTLHPLRVDLIHQVAFAIAHNDALDPGYVISWLWHLHDHLVAHNAMIGPLFVDSLVHLATTRSRETNSRIVPSHQRRILQAVRTLRGDKEARDVFQRMNQQRQHSPRGRK